MSVITDFIEKITKEGGNGNFLVINLNKGTYMQFAANKGSNSIYCEAAGKYYDTGEAFNPNQIAALKQLGWEETTSSFEGNYGLNVYLQDTPSFQIEEMIHATAKVYGATADTYSYELILE